MNIRTLFGITTIISVIGVAMVANAGDLNPPPGPVSPTGPSLTDLNNSINNIMPGGGGANINEITDVVVGASMGINDNIDDISPRGESLYDVKMKVTGLNGTSQAAGYSGYIDIETAEIFTMVALNSGPGGGDPGAPMISNIKITGGVDLDNNMALMFQMLTAGSNIALDVVFLTTGGTVFEAMRISFDQSYLTVFELTETGYELEITPIACVKFTTIGVDGMGQPGQPFTKGWNLQTNQSCN